MMGSARLGWLCLCILVWGATVRAQTQQSQPPVDQQEAGRISGTVLDPSEAIIVGAKVKLASDGQAQELEISSGPDGQFVFSSVAPGPFQLTISSRGFTPQTISGTLRPGEIYITPPITLAIALAPLEVRAQLTEVEIAEEQIKIQEKQRVLGFIPNYYVSYEPSPVPLRSKQKLRLAWKTTSDPFTFVAVGAVAGIEQATNAFSGYGQGAEGYGKRYGATYADVVTGTFIGGAILPSLLKQDPRYFYKGTGSVKSRLLQALSSPIICKGDNGQTQPNYSNVMGAFATGGIASLYYPSSSTSKPGFVFVNALIRIGESAAAGVFQEFIVRHLTPNLPTNRQAPPEQ
jgi:carboxypeptidase family protein